MLGMIITFYRKEEKDREYQDQSKINRAVASLSVSELEAAGIMLRELNSLEGLLVTGRLADQVKSTRSSFVYALRKLESACVIESRSLGMKGTYIKVLYPNLRQAVKQASNAYLAITV